MNRRTLEIGAVALALVFVLGFFRWVVAANAGFEDQGDLEYYKLLVRGWKKGQLSLDREPAPELLALPDPYDPAQNAPYKLGDVSLYKGKYYIYFGPAPAFTLMLPYALLTGRELVSGEATLFFCSLAVVLASGVWLGIRRRHFPDSRWWVAPLGVLAIGFGTQLLSLVQRPMMWELAISAGVAFSFGAVWACERAVHGRHPSAWMALAGLCVGLAVGSRPTCLLAAGVLLLPVWLAARERAPERVWWRMGLAALGSLALCGLAIMAHNYARFENPLEWGQNYQLSGAYESKLVHFSPRFFLHNFSVYFFQPLKWTAEFPFALAQAIEISHIRDYFGTEEVCGLAVTFPVVWFGLALPLAWWRRTPAESVRLAAGLGVVAAYALPVGALVLCYFSTTMRYQADYAVAVAVLALTGLLAAERAWDLRGGSLRAAIPGLAALATAVTVGVGVLVTFDYHGRSMRAASTEQWRNLARAANSAVATMGSWLGKVDGPREFKVRFRARPAGTVETFWQAADPTVGDRVLVEHLDAQLIRFGFASPGADAHWGRPLRWEVGHTHTVSVQHPVLYAPPGASWWSGARRDYEYQERSGVAVWFSGGRALTAIRRLPHPGSRRGGAIGEDFSGDVRRERTRLFREDELPVGFKEPFAPRGGTLRMQVSFPHDLRTEGEPIFAAGARFRSNIVFAEPAPGGMRITYETYTVPRVSSPVFQPRPEGHLLELEMPSFQPGRYGHEAVGDVVVRLDGVEIIRTRQPGYEFPWGHERIGSNPFGTTCGDLFRGWILEATWVSPSRPSE